MVYYVYDTRTKAITAVNLDHGGSKMSDRDIHKAGGNAISKKAAKEIQKDLNDSL